MNLAAPNHEHETLLRNDTRQSWHLLMRLVPPAVIAKGHVVTLFWTPKFLFLIYFGYLKDSQRGRRFEHDDELKHSVSEEFRRYSKGLQATYSTFPKRRWKKRVDNEEPAEG
jgi:hypothetical protein